MMSHPITSESVRNTATGAQGHNLCSFHHNIHPTIITLMLTPSDSEASFVLLAKDQTSNSDIGNSPGRNNQSDSATKHSHQYVSDMSLSNPPKFALCIYISNPAKSPIQWTHLLCWIIWFFRTRLVVWSNRRSVANTWQALCRWIWAGLQSKRCEPIWIQ
jgi:hypothetical protein